jgi:Domain of unknown function (DUF4350)
MTPISTAADPLLAERWRRARRGVLVAGLVLAAAITLGVVASQESRGYLDPEGVDPAGARALVRLLEAQGVQVDEVRTVDDALAAAGPPGDTLLVTIPDRIPPMSARRLVDAGADLVLVAPGDISAFDSALEVVGSAQPEELEPKCDLAEAERAGSARLGGVGYHGPASAQSCYRDGNLAFLVVDSAGTEHVVALGTGDPLTNRYLDEAGNASLALGLLGRNPRLIWFRPVIEPATAGQQATFSELLPGWVAPVIWQLAVAALLAAWWRARRLGPVVGEPLPVVVRAAEATEGRARLYRRGRARGHAAAELRDASAARLRSRLGLPRDTSSQGIAQAVASRLNKAPEVVDAVLSGPPPSDDAALVELADNLDRLEQEVRTR